MVAIEWPPSATITVYSLPPPLPCILYFVVISCLSLKEWLVSREAALLLVSVCGTEDGGVTAKRRLGSH